MRHGLRLLNGRWPEMKFPYVCTLSIIVDGNRATVEIIEETVNKLIVKHS